MFIFNPVPSLFKHCIFINNRLLGFNDIDETNKTSKIIKSTKQRYFYKPICWNLQWSVRNYYLQITLYVHWRDIHIHLLNIICVYIYMYMQLCLKTLWRVVVSLISRIRHMKTIFICPTHFEMSNLTASEMLELDKLTSTLIDF